ncbi:hypothetical protein MMC28_007441 [Mycoblastus sanguinarius]|nr:hypothetical protein [Mycoblastus sanguinarius]
MSRLESTDSSASRRRVAQRFTPQIPHHHPFLDPSFPAEDKPLVPSPLAPRGNLSWDLPQNAVTNLNICMKLTNKAEELLEEFHSKIPQIDEFLSEWVEMQGSSPTKTGETQIRALNKRLDLTSDDAGNSDGYIFNMVGHLDSPNATTIYLTDGIEDRRDDSEISSTPNMRSIVWPEFDGSYVHLADSVHDTAIVLPEIDIEVNKPTRKDSSPPSLGGTERSDVGHETYLSNDVYSPEPEAKTVGPYETFWHEHDTYNREINAETETRSRIPRYLTPIDLLATTTATCDQNELWTPFPETCPRVQVSY